MSELSLELMNAKTGEKITEDMLAKVDNNATKIQNQVNEIKANLDIIVNNNFTNEIALNNLNVLNKIYPEWGEG